MQINIARSLDGQMLAAPKAYQDQTPRRPYRMVIMMVSGGFAAERRLEQIILMTVSWMLPYVSVSVPDGAPVTAYDLIGRPLSIRKPSLVQIREHERDHL